jgi:hypothetical protein
MKKLINKLNIILLSIVLAISLNACTSTTLKAPCNSTGSDCLPKIKINQWSND